MKYLSILSVSFLLFACATTEEAVIETTTEENVEQVKPQRNVILKARIGDFEESDPVTIEDYRLDGNTLFLTVSYGGGCKEHDFALIGSPVIMKSLPPKRNVKLIHKSNGDMCKSIVRSVLEIDVKNLAYGDEVGGETILRINKQEINYILK